LGGWCNLTVTVSSKTSIQAGIQNSTGQRKSSELGYLTGALLLKSGTVWRPLRNREKLFGFHGVKVWSNIEMGNMERIPITQTLSRTGKVPATSSEPQCPRPQAVPQKVEQPEARLPLQQVEVSGTLNQASLGSSANDEVGIFDCEWGNCGFVFANKAFFVKHVAEAHVKTSRVYCCEWKKCSRQEPFLSKHDLSLHVRRHTGERPNICN
uniref:C2H2-type domain-containing protein n=1 Tax=Enterobius vermicularis TaxID=51028 RepID=A0A0N4UU95_ENTVE